MGFVWWFSDGYTGVMGLFEEDHAGKVPCPSHYGSYKYCQKHNLSMLMLNWPLAWGSIGQVSPLWSYFCLPALFERKSVLSRTFNWGFSERTPLLIFHKKRYTSSQHAFIHPLISSFLHSSIMWLSYQPKLKRILPNIMVYFQGQYPDNTYVNRYLLS